MKKHLEITVSGKVKNSGFRYQAVDKALDLGLTGIVKEYEKDSLGIEVEGEIDELQKFLKWCHVGPEKAKINSVDFTSTENLQNYEDMRADWFV